MFLLVMRRCLGIAMGVCLGGERSFSSDDVLEWEDALDNPIASA